MPNQNHGEESNDLSSADELLAWERGYLWDYVCAISGLNNLNILNSTYLVPRMPLTYAGDAKYNLFLGTVSRAKKNLRNAGVSPEEGQRILRDLGIRRAQTHQLATHYGQLINFAWRGTPLESGAHFMPIYNLILRTEQQHPSDRQTLHTLRRRLVYLETLAEEIDYILDVYDFDAIPVLQDWVANKVETFVNLSAEISIIITEFYLEKKGRPERIRFEDLLDVLPKIGNVFSSINASLEGYLILSLRNEMVHSAGSYVEIIDGTPQIEVEFQRKLISFGCLQDYLKSDVLSGKHALNEGYVRRSGRVYFLFRDPRFSYVSFVFAKSKKGSPSLDGAIAVFKLDLERFTKLGLSFVFLLARELINMVLS